MKKVYIEFTKKINIYFHYIENDTWIDKSENNMDLEKICDILIYEDNIYVNDVKSYKNYLKGIIKYYHKELSTVNKFNDSLFREANITKIENKLTYFNKLCNISINKNKSEKIDLSGKLLEGKILEWHCVKEFSDSNSNNNDEVYSYHTFLFPFRIVFDPLKKDKKNYFKKYKTSEFLKGIGDKKGILNTEYWEYTNLKNKDLNNYKYANNDENKKLEEFKLHYNTIQYFNSAPLQAIYGFDDDCDLENNPIVANYSFRLKEVHEKAKLIIQVGVGYESKPKEFSLTLNAIRLKVFNSDVAVMIFELENHNYNDIKDIKLINEHVRRISAPNLTMESNPCAFYWKIDFGNDNRQDFLFDDLCLLYDDIKKKKTSNISFTKILNPIKDLLTYPKPHDNILTSNYQNCKEGMYFIEPVLDDRMFVCSFIRSSQIINSINTKYVEKDGQFILSDDKKFYINNKYEYQINDKAAKNLYSIIYIDPGDSSCQSMHDVQKLLERDLYTRWIDEGTIYGITHHSFVAIATDDCPSYLIDNFLTLYVDMAILALVQRASIISFQNFATLLTNGLEKDNKKIEQVTINNLLNLQEKYISFQNQLLFFEVTPQEQGVEIYNMLTKAMYIDEEKRELKEQLDGLYTGTNANQDNNFNMYAFIFASVSLLIVFLTFIYDTISISQNFNNLISKKFTIIDIIVIICKYGFIVLMIIIVIIRSKCIYNKIIQNYKR
ncbi:hypothetical protein [Thomasclavelia cocleata]|uniref:hypothetical protein n=1 Tax=Thomasclavelia cocleata TaxID=69824 RepID=UPI0025580093|nr:hypothetical protein [Thomasclavelia cocleata]